jgi:hypothetical protein
MVVGIPDATVMLPSSSNLSTTISTTINCPQQYQQNNTSPASKPRNLSLCLPQVLCRKVYELAAKKVLTTPLDLI